MKFLLNADVAELVDALDLGSSAVRHGGSSPFIRTTFLGLWMSHILILKCYHNSELVDILAKDAISVIESYGHTYDEIVVPTVKELPVAINMFAESLEYEATLCLGVLVENNIELTSIQYQEILRSIYDYSTYFNHIVGIGIVHAKKEALEVNECLSYTNNVTQSMCDMIKIARDINSMEGPKYGKGSFTHN